MTKAAAASDPWQPAALDAAFSPQVAELLQTEHGRRQLSSRVRSRDEGLRAAVKKHLLALGWTILSRPNAAMVARLRYNAPGHDDKSYCSLPDLISDSAAASHLIVEHSDKSAAAAEQHQIIIPIDNELDPPLPPQTKDEDSEDDHEMTDEEEDDDYEPAAEEEEDDDYEPAAEEEEDDGNDDAVIAEYIALMATDDRARGRRANRLRDSAKRHLLAAGWTFWMKLKNNGREELRYRAPTGRSYISLHTACQAFVKTSRQQLPTTAPSASASNSRSKMDRRRVHAIPATILRAVRPSRVGDEDGHCRPVVIRKKRKLSELIGDGDAVNVTTKKCTTIKKKETVGADGTQLIKKSITTTTLTRKKKRRKKASQACVLLRPNSTALACQRCSRTLISVLVDKDIVVPRDRVTYRAARDGPVAKDGFITGEGIRCTCCNKTFTVAEFAAHATARREHDPRGAWARVFLKDGTSLSQCLLELMRRDVGVVAARSGGVRVKEKCGDPEGDSVCSVCNDGGDLLLCDNCPSAFHHACVGLQATPEGDWFCPSCRCGVCGGSDFDHDTTAGAGFTDRTIICCDQCEREYHVGCVRRRGGSSEEEESAAEWCRRQEEQGHWPWLCSPECSKVFQHLQSLDAAARERSIPTAVQGVSLKILRRRRPISMGCQQQEEEDANATDDAAEHGQLCAALDVLHECFMTLIEPRTQTDLTADVVFNRESELRRLNFRGYYVVGLEKAGELITVGTLRVFGTEVAELPLVGTRFAHRRRGMCHLLVTELQKVLRQVGVRRLVLPAVPELLPMWTGSLGFHPMTHSDVMEIAAEHAILSFQGTTMCQKTLLD